MCQFLCHISFAIKRFIFLSPIRARGLVHNMIPVLDISSTFLWYRIAKNENQNITRNKQQTKVHSTIAPFLVTATKRRCK